jgi:prepilin signal peptidase PulO-like enzyme (type II secretory pathway)
MGRHPALNDPVVAGRRRPWGAAWYVAPPALLLLLISASRPLPTATSVVAATGLGALARSDAATRRLPRVRVRALAVALSLTLVGSCAVHQVWDPLLRAATSATLVGVTLGLVWWTIPGSFAFSDVKVTALASGAAGATAWHLVAVTLFLSCVASAAYAICALWRHRSASAWDRTLPFAPGLAVGFVVAASLW